MSAIVTDSPAIETYFRTLCINLHCEALMCGRLWSDHVTY